MPNSVKELLYKNASFMQALDTATETKAKAISYDGKHWRVGKIEVRSSPDKLNFFQAFFSKLGHKLHALFSPSYAQRLKNSVKLFEEAFTNSEKSQLSAAKAHNQMVGAARSEQALHQLEAQLKTVTEKRVEIQNTLHPDVTAEHTKLINSLEQLAANQSKQELLQAKLREVEESRGHKISQFLNISSDEVASLKSELTELENQDKQLQSVKVEAQKKLDLLTQIEQNRVDALRAKEAELKEEIADLQEKFDRATMKPLSKPAPEEAGAPLIDPSIEVEEINPSFTLNQASLDFLEALEQKGSKELRQLFEGLLTNISQKQGDNVVKSFSTNGDGTYSLTFQKNIYFWLPALNDAGQIDPNPKKSAVFTFGNQQQQLKFSLERNLFKVQDGWGVKAHLPEKFDFFPVNSIVGRWPDASIFRISTTSEALSITGGKKVAGTLRENETVRPLSHALAHWSTQGELVSPNPQNPSKSLEAFLSNK